MLSLTENATTVIRSVMDQPELGDTSGLRITTTAEQGLAVTAVQTPSDSDLLVEDQGARVFLEPDAAVMLEDKVLDARADGQGGVEFMLSDA